MLKFCAKIKEQSVTYIISSKTYDLYFLYCSPELTVRKHLVRFIEVSKHLINWVQYWIHA